jgi:P pilus assembly chaperone PapD
MSRRWPIAPLLGLGVVLCALAVAHAGVMPERSRVIVYPGKPQQALMLANTNAYPVVVQTWIDNGEGNQAPENAVSSLVALPSVFRLQPGGLQGLRIIYDGSPLPQDRESVSWLNIYEIPPSKPKVPLRAPQVAVAMNTQVKVFYRPAGLPEVSPKVLEDLSFFLVRKDAEWVLICHNPGPFHVSFSALRVQLPGREWPVERTLDMMASPLSEKTYRIPGLNAVRQQQVPVTYTWIDDDGHDHERRVTARVKAL